MRAILPIFFALSLIITLSAQADVVAYDVQAGTAGNQAFGGALGMDFDVQHTVIVRQVGVFDDQSNGINADLTSRLWNRANTATPLRSTSFTASSPGTLLGGSRFKALSSELFLPIGFQGTIAAGGYSAAERNGNANGAAPTNWSTNDGGGLLSFVGDGRFANSGDPLAYPNAADGGPANRYATGTFTYEAANIAYEVQAGSVGNQAFGGALGMDFDVGAQPIKITHLGVFDSGGDGLARPITARLYSRSDQSEWASHTFSGTDGTLIGGSRLLTLSGGALTLPAGFQGSIVAEGYGAGEANGNLQVNSWGEYGANGAIQFVGSSRFGGAGAFPTTIDNAVAQYAAGTFRFQVVPEPSTFALCLLGIVALARGRKFRSAS